MLYFADCSLGFDLCLAAAGGTNGIMAFDPKATGTLRVLAKMMIIHCRRMFYHEKNISTEQNQTGANARVSEKNVDKSGEKNHQPASGKGKTSIGGVKTLFRRWRPRPGSAV